MKKITTITTENLEIIASMDGNRIFIEQANPVLTFDGKRYSLDMSRLVVNNDKFVYSPKKICDATKDATIASLINRYLLTGSKSLLIYGIRNSNGNFATNQELKIFKETVSGKDYIMIYSGKVFSVNKDTEYLRPVTVNYDIPVSLSIKGYKIDETYEKVINVKDTAISIGNKYFDTIESAQRYALENIYNRLNLIEEVKESEESKKIPVKKIRNYVDSSSKEFINVAKKYEKKTITAAQAAAKVNLSTGNFYKKFKEYKTLKEVAATK